VCQFSHGAVHDGGGDGIDPLTFDYQFMANPG
jgi:hypothetical protein